MNDSWHVSARVIADGNLRMLAILTFLWTFSFLKISVASSKWFFSKILCPCQPGRFPPNPSRRGFHVLLSVPCQEGQVEDKRDPVPVDEEQEGQESVNGGLGDDVGVEAVAQVDGVNVVAGAKSACAWPARDGERPAAPSWALSARGSRGGDSPFQIAVHDGEEDLQEQVDGVYQHRQKVQPCFASHCEEVVCSVVRGVMGAR